MTSTTDLRDFFAKGHAQGQGVWAIECYDIRDAIARIARPHGDDEPELRLVATLARTITRLIRGEDDPTQTMKCLTCSRVLGKKPPGAIVLLHPDVPDAKLFTSAALCRPCSDRPDTMQRVEGFYRDRVFGADAQVFYPHEPGSA